MMDSMELFASWDDAMRKGAVQAPSAATTMPPRKFDPLAVYQFPEATKTKGQGWFEPLVSRYFDRGETLVFPAERVAFVHHYVSRVGRVDFVIELWTEGADRFRLRSYSLSPVVPGVMAARHWLTDGFELDAPLRGGNGTGVPYESHYTTPIKDQKTADGSAVDVIQTTVAFLLLLNSPAVVEDSIPRPSAGWSAMNAGRERGKRPPVAAPITIKAIDGALVMVSKASKSSGHATGTGTEMPPHKRESHWRKSKNGVPLPVGEWIAVKSAKVKGWQEGDPVRPRKVRVVGSERKQDA